MALVVGRHLFSAGSKISAVFSGAPVAVLTPPVASTFPLGRSVSVCSCRAVPSRMVADHVPAARSYTALSRRPAPAAFAPPATMTFVPPLSTTAPSC